MIGGILAKLSPVGLFLKGVPRWAWIALAAAAVVGAGVWWHSNAKADFKREIVNDTITRRDAAWKKHYDKAVADARREKAEGDRARALLASTLRNRTDEEIRRTNANRDALLLRGPGKAAASTYCGQGQHTGPSALSSGQVAGRGPGVPPVGGVPNETWVGFAVVPYPELVRRGAICDANRSEVISVREADERNRKAWPNAPAFDTKR